MKKLSLEKTAQEIRRHKRFLITTHTSPEGDAIGSEMAFLRLLRKLKKRAVIVNQDPVPEEYAFFCAKEKFFLFDRKIRKMKFDCMAVLDCADLNRTGEVHKVNSGGKPVINIDHHVGNTYFGKANLVDPEASCACELVYRLYKEMLVPLDRFSALALYVGMMTDTGSFRYLNTTAFTHKAVADLMRFNIDVREAYRNIYENIPFDDCRILIEVLSRVRLAPGGKVAWAEIPVEILRHRHLSFDLSDHILSFMRMIRGVQVVVLFRENFGDRRQVRVNLRSNGKVDVNRIASEFSGGGHKTASGCTVFGSLTGVRRRVLLSVLKKA